MKRRPHRRGFTLVELLVVMAIVGTLLTLAVPGGMRMIDAADEVRCAGNLRQLAGIIQNAALDNDGRFPRLENDLSDPIHDGEKMQTLAELVQAQGAPLEILKRPADVHNGGHVTGRAASYFKLKGSSYEWLPFFEDERTPARRSADRSASSSCRSATCACSWITRSPARPRTTGATARAQ